MKYRIYAFLMTILLALGLTSAALAQSYSFSVPKEVVRVFINADGTLALDYVFEFQNASGAHPIDFVDIGLPNSNYDFNSISADVDGTPVSISSDYQGEGGSGVSVDMGSRTIAPGQSGVVHVRVGKVERMIFPDDKDETYASTEFMPTYFGSAYVNGQTNLTVILILPAGVTSDQPRYHPARGGWPGNSEPLIGQNSQGNVTYTWQSDSASAAGQYTFGASFPASVVPASAIVRTTAFDLLLGGIAALIGGLFNILPFCCFGGFFFGLPILGAVQERKRKLQYMTPKISIEGHGIKRGLTAVEAAVLLGSPLDKVMTMILFGVVKKGAAEVVRRDPLTLKIAEPQPTPLREYEKSFVEAFAKPDAERRKDLQAMVIALVKSVEEKMKGFSQRETVAYYKSINERAWAQLEAANTPEVKSQMFEEALEWTMLDKNYDERSRRAFTGPMYAPLWWGRYDPGYGSAASGSGGGSAPMSMPTASGGRSALPGAAFASSVITNTQTFAQKVLGGTDNFTQGITKVTNPPPVSTSRGGHSGGGCACACAGCACACAGGGR
ncbi:MAG: hypothetical protein OHK0031_01960 [Anaerolineales bacterium]